MLIKYITCIFVIICFIISACFYKHAGKKYANGKKAKLKSNSTFYYVYYYLRFSTIFFSLAGLLTDWPLLLKIPYNSFLPYVGLLFMLCGISIFIISKYTLGDQYSPCFDAYVPSKLVITGIYKYIRHPIYTANLLLLLGIFLASGSIWLLFNFLILSYYYIQAALYEEQKLYREFADYAAYHKSSGMFFPKFFNGINFK